MANAKIHEEGSILKLPKGWECKLAQPLWKTVRKLRKLKIELPYDPAISILGIYLDKIKIPKDIYIPMSKQHYSQYPRHGNKSTCPSTEEWIKME